MNIFSSESIYDPNMTLAELKEYRKLLEDPWKIPTLEDVRRKEQL